MAVTIKRIAELAGVSTGTVDRALHDRGRVDPKVAKRVKQIAEELHYQPNSVAKSLSIRGKKLKIAVILILRRRMIFSQTYGRGYSGPRKRYGILVLGWRCTPVRTLIRCVSWPVLSRL